MVDSVAGLPTPPQPFTISLHAGVSPAAITQVSLPFSGTWILLCLSLAETAKT